MHFRQLFCCTALAAAVLTGCSREPQVSAQEYLDRAKGHVSANKHAEAIIELQNVVRLDPRHAEARYLLAREYAASGETAKAGAEYVRASDLDPGNEEAAVAAARHLLRSGQYEDARTRAELITARNPQASHAQLVRALAIAGMRDVDAAIRAVEEVLALDSGNAQAHVLIGALSLERGRKEDAEEAFRRALEQAPDAADTHLSLAHFYWMTARPAEAEGALQKAIALAPADARAYRSLAYLYQSSGRERDAEAPLRKLAEVDTTAAPKLALAALYGRTKRETEAMALLTPVAKAAASPAEFAAATTQIAVLKYRAGQRAEAYADIEAVLGREPRHIEALLTKARFLAGELKFAEALAVAETAVGADPSSGAAQVVAGRLYASQNQHAKAIAALSQAITLLPAARTAKLQLAQMYLAAGNIAAALPLAEELVDTAPRDAQARQTLAAVLSRSPDSLTRAQALLTALVKEFPGSAPLHAQLGEVLARRRDLPAARRAFERALQINPASVEALRGIVAVDATTGNAARARAAVERRLEQAPRDSAVLLLAATTYRSLNDRAAEERVLRRLVDVDPNNPQAVAALARLYFEQQRLDPALAEYRALAAKLPDAAMPQLMVGMILQMQNKVPEAMQAYERALDLDARAAVAANNLAWLTAETGGNMDVALRLAQTALQVSPEYPPFNDTLGWVYLKRGLARQALASFQASAHADPDNPEFHYHVGLAHLALDDRRRAAAAFDTALSLKPDYRDAKDARGKL